MHISVYSMYECLGDKIQPETIKETISLLKARYNIANHICDLCLRSSLQPKAPILINV